MIVSYVVDILPCCEDQFNMTELKNKIHHTLTDPRGWSKYGYIFKRNPNAPGKILRIHLAKNKTISDLYGPQIDSLSAYVPGTHEIFINYDNWMGGSKSSMQLDRYRTYVINHEVGHALGLDHAKCHKARCDQLGMDKCPGSVMIQMTKGPDHVRPCVENEFPLDPSIMQEIAFAGNRGIISSNTLIIIGIMFVVIVIGYLIYKNVLKSSMSIYNNATNDRSRSFYPASVLCKKHARY
jgi:hypothetical protein